MKHTFIVKHHAGFLWNRFVEMVNFSYLTADRKTFNKHLDIELINVRLTADELKSVLLLFLEINGFVITVTSAGV